MTSDQLRSSWLAVLLVGAASVAVTLWVWPTRGSAPSPADGRTAVDRARGEPFTVPPRAIRLLPVSQRELDRINDAVQLPDRSSRLSSSDCLHLLRVHGLRGRLRPTDRMIPTGEGLVKLFTDGASGEAAFGHAAVIRTRSGVRFPNGDLTAVTYSPWLGLHRDQTLAALGELGLPLSLPLTVDGARSTLREVLRDSVANYHPKQIEITWTATAYALYLAPARSWVNRYGERGSFDQLVEEMLARPLDQSSCGGLHLIYALTVVARVDEARPVLSDRVRSALRDYLRRGLDVAVSSQHPDGSWSLTWGRGRMPDSDPEAPWPADTPEYRLLTTGHLTEWLLYLPDGIRPPDDVLRRAGLWLRDAVARATPGDVRKQFCPFSHAVCALRQVAFLSPESTHSGLTADGPAGVYSCPIIRSP